eukprot:scaffold92201_cov35-Tisochrysis_lutea.AAC.1
MYLLAASLDRPDRLAFSAATVILIARVAISGKGFNPFHGLAACSGEDLSHPTVVIQLELAASGSYSAGEGEDMLLSMALDGRCPLWRCPLVDAPTELGGKAVLGEGEKRRERAAE